MMRTGTMKSSAACFSPRWRTFEACVWVGAERVDQMEVARVWAEVVAATAVASGRRIARCFNLIPKPQTLNLKP